MKRDLVHSAYIHTPIERERKHIGNDIYVYHFNKINRFKMKFSSPLLAFSSLHFHFRALSMRNGHYVFVYNLLISVITDVDVFEMGYADSNIDKAPRKVVNRLKYPHRF